jgi:hypothetical protein
MIDNNSKKRDLRFIQGINDFLKNDLDDLLPDKTYPNVPKVTEAKTIEGVRHVKIEIEK